MVDPIAKCRCGKLYTPVEWAELRVAAEDARRRECSCGLLAVRIMRGDLTFEDIKREYEKAMEESE